MDEILYSKLYEKYTNLKARKFQELEKPSKEQELSFMSYVTAAEQLIEHLRSEKDRLREQVNGLRNEINSLRTKEYDQSLEYQDLLMEDNRKMKELKEENERLLKLQREGLFSNVKDSDIKILNASVDNQNRSENTRISPNNTATTQIISHSVVPASIQQPGKKSMPNDPSSVLRLPECCRDLNTSSDGSGNEMESVNCVYQALIESLVGMKLSASNQLHGLCISALHESTGYTFSLTLVFKAGEKETKLLYKAISLGTLARIAPEWMREEIMFSVNMCSIFFERISRFIRLNK